MYFLRSNKFDINDILHIRFIIDLYKYMTRTTWVAFKENITNKSTEKYIMDNFNWFFTLKCLAKFDL